MRRVDDADGARELAEAILAPDRARPIVAVSTRAGRDAPEVDVDALEREIASLAELYLVATGEPTWELAARVPDRLEVYGGALRIWWPGVTETSDPYDHPLFLLSAPADVERKPRELVDELRARAGRAAAPGPRPAPGDIVEAKVSKIVPHGAFLDVGGHRGFIHVSELSDRWVSDPAEVVEEDELVRARVLQTEDGRLAFSFRESGDLKAGSLAAARQEIARLEEDVARLRHEKRELAADRRELLDERRRLRERIQQLEQPRRRPRAGADRPVESDADFVDRVREAYDRIYVGDDRERFPLRPFSLNPAFLGTLRGVGSLSADRVAQVCAHVAAGRAHELDGLQVHPLKRGEGGARAVVRASDGARAMRCALQRESPSARRLHYWELGGNRVEFASVVVHDDFSIPE